MGFYVYVYLDPRKPGEYIYGDLQFDYEPFYVGEGKGKRDTQHLRDLFRKGSKKTTYKDNKLKAILKENLTPIILHIADGLSQQEAWDLEIRKIAQIGRICTKEGPLTNLHEGGCGGTQPEEVLERVSKIISQRHKEGRYDEKNARPVSKETRAKQSLAHQGKIPSKETIMKRVATRAGYTHSEETRELIKGSLEKIKDKLALTTETSWTNPDTRKKRSEGIKKAYESKRRLGATWMWVNNGRTEGNFESTKALILLDEGWVKGRLPQGKSLWVNDGTSSKMLREDKALAFLEQGWVLGRLPLKKTLIIKPTN